jgi:hypothetical protein
MWWCAGINRHGIEDERALRGRSSDPLGPEFCAVRCEAEGLPATTGAGLRPRQLASLLSGAGLLFFVACSIR